MTLEWLRRVMPQFDEQLRTFLFTSGPIEHANHAEESGGASGSLGIGSLSKGGK